MSKAWQAIVKRPPFLRGTFFGLRDKRGKGEKE